MDIQISYDSSTASAPSWFQSAVAYAVAQFDALITNPITVKIAVGWGEENGNAIDPGAVADNQSNGTYMSYGSLTKAMAAAATSASDQIAMANIPTTDFTHGGKFYVPLALQRTLGLQASTTVVDGYIGLNGTKSFTYSPSGQIAAGTYDVISVLEHEISEVLGRVVYSGQGSATGVYTPEDLFRYSAAGQRSLTSGAGNFSIDAQTMLASFNNPGDAADWNPNVVGDVFSNVTAGIASHLSSVDFTMMDVLGYSVDPLAVASTTATATANAPALSGPLNISPAYDAAVEASASSENFVFKQKPGQVTIDFFLVSGSSHDTLSLSSNTFSSLADVLRHTSMSGGNATIHITPTDSVELFGVTKAQLRTHPGAVTFHP